MAFEMLDVGIIMGSKSLEIFEDMVKRYPGAEYFYEDMKSHCSCGVPGCARDAMQDTLKHLFEDDKERVAVFFEKLSHCDTQPTETQIQAILTEMGLICSTGTERDIVDARIQEELEAMFPGSKVIPLH